MTQPIRVLCTGGSGFLGQALITAIRAQEPQWYIINLDRIGTEKVKCDLFVQADITNANEVTSAITDASPDVIIHAASMLSLGALRYDKSDRNRATMARTNIEGTRNVIRAARECGCRALVYTSSCTVITDDLDHDYAFINEDLPTGKATLCYGWSKSEAEKLVLAADDRTLSTCALRSPVIIGQDLVSALHACIARKETSFRLGNCHNLMDFVSVQNVADAHILAVRNLLSESRSAAGQALFISNDEPVYFRDFMLATWAQFGHIPPFEVSIPIWLASSLGLACEVIAWVTGIEGSLSRGSVLDAIAVKYADISRAKDLLGYRPRVSTADGLTEACDSYKDLLARRDKTLEP